MGQVGWVFGKLAHSVLVQIYHGCIHNIYFVIVFYF